MAYTIEGRELSDQLLLFSAEVKKLNSKLEYRKFFIKKEGESVSGSSDGKPIKAELEKNSFLRYKS